MADVRSRALCLRGAKVHTMDAERPRAEAIAVRDGRIAAVGAWSDVAPFSRGLPVYHLNGHTVLPGFIDSHVHLTWTGLKEVALDFSGTEGVDDVADILRPAVSDAPQGALVFGMGINHYLFPERRLPTREDLDAVAPPTVAQGLGAGG